MKRRRASMSVSDFMKAYKWHVVIWIIGLIVLGNFIYKKVTAPTYLLNGVLLGAAGGEDAATTLATDFAELVGYGDTVYAVNLDTEYSYIPGSEENAENNYKATEKIVSQVENESLDFVAGPLDSMTDIGHNAMFVELTTYLSPDQLKLVEPYLLYVDNAVIEELDEAFENKEDTSKIKLPDPRKPEEMEEPVAVMIDMSSCEEFATIYADSGKTIALGLITSAPNEDMLIKFIDYLMK